MLPKGQITLAELNKFMSDIHNNNQKEILRVLKREIEFELKLANDNPLQYGLIYSAVMSKFLKILDGNFIQVQVYDK